MSKLNKTIKREITIKIGVATVAILVVIFASLIYDFRTVQISDVREDMEEVINNIAFKVNKRNQQMTSLLDMMVNYQQLSGFGRREESIYYLFNILDDNDNLLSASYHYEPNADGKDKEYANLKDPKLIDSKLKEAVNEQGRFLASVVRKSGLYLSSPKDNSHQFYQKTKQRGEMIVDGPFSDEMMMIMTYSAPLMIEGEFRGVAAIDRNLGQIQSDFYDTNHYEGAEFYLFDAQDRLIATSNQFYLQDSNNKLTKQTKDKKKLQEKVDNLSDITATGEGIQEREDRFIAAEAIKVGNWKLLMTVNKADALHRVNYITENMVKLGILAVIFLTVLLYYLINRSLQPIPAATNFAKSLANEEFEIADLNIEAKNEIGELSQALNRMKDNLSNKIQQINKNNQKLEKEKNKLQKYLDIAEVVFMVVNRNRQVTLVNDKGAQILGLSKDEIIGDSLIENYFLEEEKAKAREETAKLLSGEEEIVTNYETTILTNQGVEKTIIWNSIVIKDETGEVEKIINSGMDITEKRSLQEELEYSQLKTQFFANLSHEFKTPLNLVFSALQMLNLLQKTNSSLAADGKFDKYTSIIKQNSYRLLRLVNNLVDITRINANSFELDFSNYEIVDLMENIVRSVEDYVENKERNLSFDAEIEEEIIACDFFSLERIMLNLISNAVKFTDKDDEIRVKLFKEDNEIVIVVEDTGVGIPEDKKESIFEKFKKVNSSSDRNHEGSGIGLSLVQSLVELHDGTIRVESEVGVGSKFIIRLPIRELEESKATGNQPEDRFERIELEFADIYTE
ncbi:MAG: ATP-binding protein [Halanaerobacter sp.]